VPTDQDHVSIDHWPRGALPFSLIMVVGSITVCVAIARAAEPGSGLMMATVSVAVLAFGAGAYLYRAAILFVLRGEPIPSRLPRLSILAGLAGVIAFGIEGSVGGAILAGLWGGLMSANSWTLLALHRRPTPHEGR
jgi:hypothetical protein